MMSSRKDEILENLVKKSPNIIEYVALFSNEAELIAQPIGEWDEESFQNLIKGLFYLSEQGEEFLEKGEIQRIWLTSEKGHLVWVCCHPTVFLLVKANVNGLIGELRRVIEQSAKAIQVILNEEEEEILNPISKPENAEDESFNQQTFWEKNDWEDALTGLESLEDINPNQVIRYRGRKA